MPPLFGIRLGLFGFLDRRHDRLVRHADRLLLLLKLLLLDELRFGFGDLDLLLVLPNLLIGDLPVADRVGDLRRRDDPADRPGRTFDVLLSGLPAVSGRSRFG